MVRLEIPTDLNVCNRRGHKHVVRHVCRRLIGVPTLFVLRLRSGALTRRFVHLRRVLGWLNLPLCFAWDLIVGSLCLHVMR